MKVLVIILSIVMMAKISQSSSLKTANDDVKAFEAMMTFLKDYIPRTQSIIKDTLNDIPNTDAYHKYRLELESYLEYFSETTAKSSNCVDKHFRILHRLAAIGKVLVVKPMPTEAEEVMKLLEAHGIGSIDVHFFDWRNEYNVKGFTGKVEDLYSKDDVRFRSIYSEVC